MIPVAEQVAAGMALLDEREPGWWREDAPHPVGLGILRVASNCHCVLGQLHGSYRAGRAVLDLPRDAALGFRWATGDDGEPVYGDGPALDAEWKRVIAGRRAAA